MYTSDQGFRRRVAQAIDRYRSGGLTMVDLLNGLWKDFVAADLDPAIRHDFDGLYYALTGANDANQPWMPAGTGSDAEVEAALSRLEAWAGNVENDPA